MYIGSRKGNVYLPYIAVARKNDKFAIRKLTSNMKKELVLDEFKKILFENFSVPKSVINTFIKNVKNDDEYMFYFNVDKNNKYTSKEDKVVDFVIVKAMIEKKSMENLKKKILQLFSKNLLYAPNVFHTFATEFNENVKTN